MSILLSDKSKEYIKKRNISNLLIDVSFIEEPCTQICSPKVEAIKDSDVNNFKNFAQMSGENLVLFFSDQFLEIYGKLDECKLDLGGFFKKILILENVEPIIKNTCKI